MRFQSPPNILNQSVIVAASVSASASVSFPVTNLYSDGMLVYFNIHALPGSASTTAALKIRFVDPVNGTLVTVGQIPAAGARSATGMTMLSMSPFGNSASAGGVQNILSMVPKDMNFLVSMSTGATSKECTFSIGVHFTIS